MQARQAQRRDRHDWLRMRSELWPDCEAQHEADIAAYFAGDEGHTDQALVCESDAGELLGFIELRVRNYAEGSRQHRVPFVEGWYAHRDARGMGVGAALVAAAEAWAIDAGYRELASNTTLDNKVSCKAHLALGFEEVERTVNFLKPLG